MTPQKIRQQILDEMNARRIDGKTYIDSEWLLDQYEDTLRQSHCDELVRLIESQKRLERWTVMTTPVVDEKAIAYNQAIDQALTIVREVYKGKE